MHVAIHRTQRVACRPWLVGSVLPGLRAPADWLVGRYSGGGGDVLDIRSAQKLAWENKLAKGFNTTDVPLEFCLLSGEVAEAFDAWRKGRAQVAEELADTAIFLARPGRDDRR